MFKVNIKSKSNIFLSFFFSLSLKSGPVAKGDLVSTSSAVEHRSLRFQAGSSTQSSYFKKLILFYQRRQSSNWQTRQTNQWRSTYTLYGRKKTSQLISSSAVVVQVCEKDLMPSGDATGSRACLQRCRRQRRQQSEYADLPKWKCWAGNQKFTRELLAQKQRARHAAARSNRTWARNHLRFSWRVKPHLKWISFGQSTSVPHVVTGVFLCFHLGSHRVVLCLASSKRSVQQMLGDKGRKSIFLPKKEKKNVSF